MPTKNSFLNLPGGKASTTVNKGEITFNGTPIDSHSAQTNSLLGEIQIEERIWKKIFDGSGLNLDFFHVDCATSLPAFIELFTNRRIEEMSKFLNRKKQEVKARLKKTETFLSDFVNENNAKIGLNIKKRIELIHKKQKSLIENSADKLLYKIEKNPGVEISDINSYTKINDKNNITISIDKNPYEVIFSDTYRLEDSFA